MKILVFLNHLIIGGAEVNSIDLATHLRDHHGHEFVFFAAPGPMSQTVRARGLALVDAPHPSAHPSLERMRALSALVGRVKPDLLQVWDWRACLDAYFSAHLLHRVPMHMILSNMQIDRLLPKAVPASYMTPDLVDQARAAGRGPVDLLLPPVDVHSNSPTAADGQAFRRSHGVGDEEQLVVTVSRLANSLKGESLRRTIDACGRLGRRHRLKLIIVGEGDARAELERLAANVNRGLGRDAVVLAGPLIDPRPAYAAADIVVGMGGSSLRALAFSKPVVVVGEQGFSAPFDTDTAESFLYNGMYGIGDGDPGNEKLVSDLDGLLQRSDQWLEIGAFSREFVMRHFSLEAVGARLDEASRRFVGAQAGRLRSIGDAVRTAAILSLRPLRPRELRARMNSTGSADAPANTPPLASRQNP